MVQSGALQIIEANDCHPRARIAANGSPSGLNRKRRIMI